MKKSKTTTLSLKKIEEKQLAEMPDFIKPELATLVSFPPKENNWSFEIKYDGYRFLAIIKDYAITLKTRNNIDWSQKFPTIIQALKKLSLRNAIIDGEIVVLDKNKISRFELLQNAIQSQKNSIMKYFVFDLIYYDHYYLADAPLEKRRQLLKKLVQNNQHKNHQIQFSNNLKGNVDQILKRLCKQGYEGVIAKNQQSSYQSRRTRDWLKIKCSAQQEFVIGGFTEPRGAREFFGALLLGYFTKDKKLIYCGKVGTGFDSSTLREVFSYLKKLTRSKSYFVNTPLENGIHWIKPKLIAEITFREWTKDGYLRQPVFHGLRFDKTANEVVKEISYDKRSK